MNCQHIDLVHVYLQHNSAVRQRHFVQLLLLRRDDVTHQRPAVALSRAVHVNDVTGPQCARVDQLRGDVDARCAVLEAQLPPTPVIKSQRMIQNYFRSYMYVCELNSNRSK